MRSFQVGVAMFSTGNFKNVVGIAGSGGDTGGDNDSKGDKKADGGKETLYQVGQFTSTY